MTTLERINMKALYIAREICIITAVGLTLGIVFGLGL